MTDKAGKLHERYSAMSQAARAGIWFVVCSCIQSGIKFIASPVFANIMSVEQYGLVTVYTSWFSIMYIFATLALGRANGVFYVAMVKFPDDRDGFTSAAQGLTAVLCVICFSIVYCSVAIFGDWMQIGVSQYAVMCLELIGYGCMLIWSLRMRYSYAYRPLLIMTAVYSVGTMLVPVIALLLFPEAAGQAVIKNTSGAIIAFAVGLAALVSCYRKNKRLFNWNYWKFAFRFNLPLIPHYLSNVILVQSDRIMIARLIGEGAAAIYSVAYNLGVAAQVVTQALINAINPWMYQKLEKKRGGEISRAVIPLLCVVSGLILGILLVMPEVFDLFFPAAYLEAIDVIPPVAAGVLWAFIFNIYASFELYYMGNKRVSVASATGAVLNIILNLMFIPVFGYVAAAYTTLICDIVYAFMHSVFANKLLKKNLPDTEVIPNRIVWGLGIGTTGLAFVILLLYPYVLIRYAVVLLLLIIVWVNRKRVMRILRFKSEK